MGSPGRIASSKYRIFSEPCVDSYEDPRIFVRIHGIPESDNNLGTIAAWKGEAVSPESGEPDNAENTRNAACNWRNPRGPARRSAGDGAGA